MEEQSENPVPWASAAAPVPVHCSAVFGVATSTRKALGSMEGASTVTGRVRNPSQSLLVMFLREPSGTSQIRGPIKTWMPCPALPSRRTAAL